MRITQLRILSLFLAVISTILLCVTVSTNRWYSVKANNVGRIAQLSYGLFYECLDGDCKPLKRNEGWRTVTIICTILSFLAMLIASAGIVFVTIMNKRAKVAAIFLFIAAALSVAALMIYPLKMELSQEGHMDISYFLGCTSAVLSGGAGVFILIAKEERVTPLIQSFSNISLDDSRGSNREPVIMKRKQ